MASFFYSHCIYHQFIFYVFILVIQKKQILSPFIYIIVQGNLNKIII